MTHTCLCPLLLNRVGSFLFENTIVSCDSFVSEALSYCQHLGLLCIGSYLFVNSLEAFSSPTPDLVPFYSIVLVTFPLPTPDCLQTLVSGSTCQPHPCFEALTPLVPAIRLQPRQRLSFRGGRRVTNPTTPPSCNPPRPTPLALPYPSSRAPAFRREARAGVDSTRLK